MLELKDSYNKFRQLPPIPSQLEKFEGQPVEIASFQLGYNPQIRCLFLNSNEEGEILELDIWRLVKWFRGDDIQHKEPITMSL